MIPAGGDIDGEASKKPRAVERTRATVAVRAARVVAAPILLRLRSRVGWVCRW